MVVTLAAAVVANGEIIYGAFADLHSAEHPATLDAAVHFSLLHSSSFSAAFLKSRQQALIQSR